MVERQVIVWNWNIVDITEHDPDAYFPQWQYTPNHLQVGNWLSVSYRPYYIYEMSVWPDGGWSDDGEVIAQNTTVWEWVDINSDNPFPF